MKQFTTLVALFAILLLLCIFSTIAWYAWDIINAIVQGAKKLEPNVYVPLSITVLTAVLGLSATLFTQNRVRKREIEAAHRDRKIEIYLEFLKTYERLMQATKPELGYPKIDENELVRTIIGFRAKAVLWGSPGVLRAVSNLGHLGTNDGAGIIDVLEALQREMRKDIGLSNFGLEKDFFAKLILSNPNELDDRNRAIDTATYAA